MILSTEIMKPFQPQTIIEPFRVRSVEPIHFTTMAQREAALKAAGYNLFLLHADDVLIDLLTDSGTGAMSSAQWAGMIASDESYAGASVFYRFEAAVRASPASSHVIPTHQGRAAEHILFTACCASRARWCPTTRTSTPRAPMWSTRAEARDLVMAEVGRQPALIHPFKGNMDLDALERTIRDGGPRTSPA
jgi:tryptophanase